MCGFVGAGDAKFFGAVGAFLGPPLTLRAFLVGTTFGGLAAVPALWRRYGRRANRENDGSHEGLGTRVTLPEESLPYAVPLALGAAIIFAFDRLGG